MHFTHVQHLRTVVERGLLSGTVAQAVGVLQVEVGRQDIKQRRRTTPVPLPPGGVVADYVPFYFAPRSPMMFVIDRGNVPTYQSGCDDLVYLVTTLERLVDLGLRPICSDRNATIAVATFSSVIGDLDTLVDWDLMAAQWWYNTPEAPDRKERRMAECLVHGLVPWAAFTEVVTKTATCAETARHVLAAAGVATKVRVRPGWYF